MQIFWTFQTNSRGLCLRSQFCTRWATFRCLHRAIYHVNQFFPFVKARAITLLHADALLVTEYTISGADESLIQNLIKPDEMIRNTVVAANLYNKSLTLIWDCLVVCGLRKYTVSGNQKWMHLHIQTETNPVHRIFSSQYHSNYDGFLFHDLCVKFGESKADYDHELEPVKTMRLYAEWVWRARPFATMLSQLYFGTLDFRVFDWPLIYNLNFARAQFAAFVCILMKLHTNLFGRNHTAFENTTEIFE